MIEEIYTPNSPTPGGHYAQAIKYENFLFVSGILPINPQTGEKQNGTIEEQTHQVLRNLDAVLTAGGSSKDKVLKTNVYIADISYWAKVNEIYAAYFGHHTPARTVVPVKELHFGFEIELEAVAIIK